MGHSRAGKSVTYSILASELLEARCHLSLVPTVSSNSYEDIKSDTKAKIRPVIPAHGEAETVGSQDSVSQ